MSALTPVAPADCVFCGIVRGEVPAKMVAAWHDAVAFVPRDPVTGDLPDGHILVVPAEHATDFLDDAEVTATTMRRAAQLAKQINSNCGLSDWNLITSAGEDATQTVPHLHAHLVRRVEDDGLHLPWTGQKRSHA